jgi:hypothetical protein
MKLCTALGIHLVYGPHVDVTHLLCKTLSLTPTVALALLQAQHIVTPAWLEEVVRRGALPPTDPGSLEYTFALPSESQYRPECPSDILPTSVLRRRGPSLWSPSEERVGMLNGRRFLCIVPKGREIAEDLRTLLETGRGTVEVFSADLGAIKWQRALSKARKATDELVLLAEESAVRATVGDEKWEELSIEARR